MLVFSAGIIVIIVMLTNLTRKLKRKKFDFPKISAIVCIAFYGLKIYKLQTGEPFEFGAGAEYKVIFSSQIEWFINTAWPVIVENSINAWTVLVKLTVNGIDQLLEVIS